MAETVRPVRWGVISTANINRKVLPGMKKSPWVELTAIASRSPERAREGAEEYGIPIAYSSYEALIDDPGIEAIYNPLPNHLHVPLTLAAAAKGKHVLCEKPIALTAAEAEQLRAQAGKVIIAEAFMVRHHPQWQMARQMVRDGAVGTPRLVQVLFSYFNDDPENVRNQAEIGGGGIYDLGCYAILSGRYIFGAEPERVVSVVDRDPGFGTDRLASALVDFGGGRQLVFSVATQLSPYQRVHVMGTDGRVTIEIPFNAPQGGAMRLFHDREGALAGASQTIVTLPEADQYQLQGENFSKAVRGAGTLEFGVEDAVLNMRVIDAVFRSERTGAWARP